MARKRDRRKVADRRAVMQAVLFNRRRIVDRRIDNILAERDLLGEVVLHPTITDAFRRRAFNN